jgi:hypothetical protein
MLTITRRTSKHLRLRVQYNLASWHSEPFGCSVTPVSVFHRRLVVGQHNPTAAYLFPNSSPHICGPPPLNTQTAFEYANCHSIYAMEHCHVAVHILGMVCLPLQRFFKSTQPLSQLTGGWKRRSVPSLETS